MCEEKNMKSENLIEKYFNGSLSKEEFLELEKRIDEDEKLRFSFYEQLEVQKAIPKIKHQPLKDRFKKLEENQKRKRNRKWPIYAASIAAILTTIFLLYDPAVNNEMLFAEHFRVYPNVILLSNRGENNKEDFVKEAFLLYETKNYKKASDAFNKLYSISKEDYFLFYQGISLLADNNFQKGIDVLENYNWEKNNSDFTQKANWYLGLAYLKQNKLLISKSYFNKVANSNDDIAPQAILLLKELN